MIWITIATIVLFSGFVYIPVPWLVGRWIRRQQKVYAQRNRQAYLTFDDGPGNRLTPKILEILRENGIRASFFLLGRNLVGRESIVKRIQQDGHCIASHSFSHLHAWKEFPGRLVSDISGGWRIIDRARKSGKARYPFRPPNGKVNLVILVYLFVRRIPIIYWSIDSGDTWPVEKRNPNCAAHQLGTSGGGIVLFHDFDRSTDETDGYVLQSLQSVIRTGKAMNMQFSTVDQLSPSHFSRIMVIVD